MVYCNQSSGNCIMQSLFGLIPQLFTFILGVRYFLIFKQQKLKALEVKSRVITPILCIATGLFQNLSFLILVIMLQEKYSSILNIYVMLTNSFVWYVQGYWIYHYHVYKVSKFFSAPRINILINSISSCTFSIMSFQEIFKTSQTDEEDAAAKITMIVFLFLMMLCSFLTNILLCFEIDIEDQSGPKQVNLKDSKFSSTSLTQEDNLLETNKLGIQGNIKTIQGVDSRFKEGGEENAQLYQAPKKVEVQQQNKKQSRHIKIQGFKEITRFNKKTIVYIILFQSELLTKTTIFRSYREFSQLHLHLKQFYKSIQFPEFPQKNKQQNSLSKNELSQRSLQLERLMKFIISNNIFDKIINYFLDPSIEDFVEFIINQQKKKNRPTENNQEKQNSPYQENQKNPTNHNQEEFSGKMPEQFTIISERPSEDEESIIYQNNNNQIHQLQNLNSQIKSSRQSITQNEKNDSLLDNQPPHKNRKHSSMGHEQILEETNHNQLKNQFFSNRLTEPLLIADEEEDN